MATDDDTTADDDGFRPTGGFIDALRRDRDRLRERVAALESERDAAHAALARYKIAVTDVLHGTMLDTLEDREAPSLGVRLSVAERERDAAVARLAELAAAAQAYATAVQQRRARATADDAESDSGALLAAANEGDAERALRAALDGGDDGE